jgi:hypothetical protein
MLTLDHIENLSLNVSQTNKLIGLQEEPGWARLHPYQRGLRGDLQNVKFISEELKWSNYTNDTDTMVKKAQEGGDSLHFSIWRLSTGIYPAPTPMDTYHAEHIYI